MEELITVTSTYSFSLRFNHSHTVPRHLLLTPAVCDLVCSGTTEYRFGLAISFWELVRYTTINCSIRRGSTP